MYYAVLAAQHPSKSHAGKATPLPSSVQYMQKMQNNDQAGVGVPQCCHMTCRLLLLRGHGQDTRSQAPSRLTSSTYIL